MADLLTEEIHALAKDERGKDLTQTSCTFLLSTKDKQGRDRTRAANTIRRWWRHVRHTMATTASIVLQWRTTGLTDERMANASLKQYVKWCKDKAVESATYHCMRRMLFLCTPKGDDVHVFERKHIQFMFGCAYFPDDYLEGWREDRNSHVDRLMLEAVQVYQALESLCSAFENILRPKRIYSAKSIDFCQGYLAALRKSYLAHIKAYSSELMAAEEEQYEGVCRLIHDDWLEHQYSSW